MNCIKKFIFSFPLTNAVKIEQNSQTQTVKRVNCGAVCRERKIKKVNKSWNNNLPRKLFQLGGSFESFFFIFMKAHNESKKLTKCNKIAKNKKLWVSFCCVLFKHPRW